MSPHLHLPPHLHAVGYASFTVLGCRRNAELNSGKFEVQLPEKKPVCTFFKVRPSHLLRSSYRHAPVARTALRCVDASRAHAANRKQIMSAQCYVQEAAPNIETIEVQFSQKRCGLNFSELALPICIGHNFATHLSVQSLDTATHLSLVAIYSA